MLGFIWVKSFAFLDGGDKVAHIDILNLGPGLGTVVGVTALVVGAAACKLQLI